MLLKFITTNQIDGDVQDNRCWQELLKIKQRRIIKNRTGEGILEKGLNFNSLREKKLAGCGDTGL